MPPKKVKTEAASGGDFKAEELVKLSWTWKKNGTLIYGDSGTKPSELIIAMDMDDTLIMVKSGAKFAKDAHDWIPWHDSVREKLQEYHKKGYKLVIFTNQNGITKGHTKEEHIKTKIQNLAAHVGCEFQALIASDDDEYRKPNLGGWNFFNKNMNGGKKVDLQKSFFLGDAAGRPKTGSKKKDFSDTDYKFALNTGLPFQTPEMFFLGEKETIPEIEFKPKEFFKEDLEIIKGKGKGTKIASDSKEMIIFVGSPASGKTTFRATHLPDYVHVNNDTLKNKKKCMQVAEQAMKDGKSLVIDNTNPEKATRAEYIALAKEHGYPVRCFFFDFSKDLSFHLDTLRKVNPHREHHSKRVGDMVIHTWFKKLEKPDLKEGFKEVCTVNFVAGPFKNDEDKSCFYAYNW